MTVPWVSRDAYEAVTGERDRLLAALQIERARVNTLLKTLATIATPKAPETPAVPDYQQFPPLVAAALSEATAGLPADVRRAAYQKAQRMIDLKEKPEDVADLIRRGEPVEV